MTYDDALERVNKAQLCQDELTYAEHKQAYDRDKFEMKDGKLEARDNINPSYYVDMKIAPSDYIHANKIPYFEGNVIKYISRHRGKNGAEDVKKAIKYCEMILEKDYYNVDAS